MHLIISAIGFIIWAISIISIYYSDRYGPINHLESSTWYGTYIATLIFIYISYKAYSILAGWKKIRINLFHIIGIILFHIFILAVIYSGLPEVTRSPFMTTKPSWIILFIHIIELLLYPLILVLLTRSAGLTTLMTYMPSWRDIDMRLRVPAEITIGFFIFTIGLLIIGSLGMFTLPGLIWVLAVLWLIWYRWHKETYSDITKRYITLENHALDGTIAESLNLKLLSIEFGFIFLTFLLGISLISIIRPMPIWWDDLGVYMNFPKIMATTGTLLEWAGMYVWQLITATGFLFSYTAAQAFYVNQLGGILAVIAIISTLSFAFEKKWRTLLLSLPVLFATVYYAMPMTVFQQAKDMKLDPAYLFFCISGIMLLFHVWKWDHDTKKDYKILSIIGLIIGFSFSVKLTSVMLILGCLWVISYRLLGFLGYVGFFALFLALFTRLHLWGIMNVPMPPNDSPLINSISLVLWVSWIICLVASIFKKNHFDTKFLFTWWTSVLVFSIGCILACSPWILKNIHEIGIQNIQKSSITGLLTGSGGTTPYDYEGLYTPEENEKRKTELAEWMTTDGKSENEDLGRYFWYDGGLNNYLKLPPNLTFQKNQSGEFTDITYIFLALLPGLLLFIRGKRSYTMLMWMGLLLLFMTFYYFPNIKSEPSSLSRFFGNFSLIIESGNWKSYGYAILLAMNIGILSIFHFALEKNDDNKKLQEVIMFMGIYAFLFSIAAFGIVWYGIVIYFGFFLIMGYSALGFLREKDEDFKNEDPHFNILMSGALFIFIALYMVRSSFPHGWNNLKNAYYNEYKYNTLSQEESIFAYRSDYLLPIATMNLTNIAAIFDDIGTQMQSKQMKEFFATTDVKNLPLDTLHAFIMKYRSSPDMVLRKDVEKLGQHIYSNVLYPKKGNENTGWIYRIGTFMTYLINENRKRYLDDSLLMLFGWYFYDASPEKSIENMKSLWLKYLLVDLNAATIDRDPRHALTDRSEKLLLTMTANNLKLVTTDNLCLELAINERKKGKLTTPNEFIDIAGTNSESYRNGLTLSRNQKLSNCHRYIVEKLINTGEYPKVDAIKNEILESNAAQDNTKLQNILLKHAGQSWFALFEIIDTPMNTSPEPVTATATWVSQ